MAHITTRETSKGTAYVVKWRPQSGTFKEKTFYVKRDAERYRDRIEHELADGNATEHLSGRSKTFRQAAEDMIAASALLSRRPSTATRSRCGCTPIPRSSIVASPR